jgi:hypothetical protein
MEAKSVRKEKLPGLYPYLKMSTLFMRNADANQKRERITMRLQVTHGVHRRPHILAYGKDEHRDLIGTCLWSAARPSLQG